VRTRIRTGAPGALLALAAIGISVACSSHEQVLHGVITQLRPAICVGAPRATGECFDPSSADTSALGIEVGDCVVVRYTPNNTPGQPIAITSIKKETCR